MIYVKDEDGLYTADPKKDRNAKFIPQITVAELEALDLEDVVVERSRARADEERPAPALDPGDQRPGAGQPDPRARTAKPSARSSPHD